ncbi:MAG: glycosyltransferase family 2 protein [Desulfobulbaceae bacterium]|nr:glycosyltransferase family 2 protein [Desulfobulbaceae bacterium]
MTGKTAAVAIVILTCNQKDYTLACLQSLSTCSYPHIEIVVVDNDSQDGTEEAVAAAFPAVHYLKNDFNAGVAGGRNIGIRFLEDEGVDYDYLLILDNDTVVEKDFLQPMVEVLDRDPQIGVVSPKIYLLGEDKILDQAGGSIVNFYTGSTAKRGHREEDTGQYDNFQTQACLPSGACSLSRRSVVAECGGLDEIFNPYGFEDLDYSLRVKKAGYRLAYVPQSIIYHKGSKTGFQKYTEEYAAIKGKHLRTFMTRHASPWQLLCFTVLLPLLGARTLVREARKGNVKAAARLFRSFIRK